MKTTLVDLDEVAASSVARKARLRPDRLDGRLSGNLSAPERFWRGGTHNAVMYHESGEVLQSDSNPNGRHDINP